MTNQEKITEIETQILFTESEIYKLEERIKELKEINAPRYELIENLKS